MKSVVVGKLAANTAVSISALQKNSAFQDDLLRKLAGKTLIQRAVEKARQLGVSDSAIHVYTDSEPVALSAERAGVNTYIDLDLISGTAAYRRRFYEYLKKAIGTAEWLIRLSPYAPLLENSALVDAIQLAEKDGSEIVVGVRLAYNRPMQAKMTSLNGEFFDQEYEKLEIRSGAFTLLRASTIMKEIDRPLIASFLQLGEDAFEVRTYRDWWVCEKLLQRKRIVFRVIGGSEVGMGHIYRALSLAHEITDHEVIFVTDSLNEAAVTKLTNYEYRLGVFDPREVVQGIGALKPDLVVNDILDTVLEDVWPLQKKGVRVINFEDLGEGARVANATVNELYDEPQFSGGNTYWGNRYFFVRDEFADATPCTFKEKVDALLLVFGGIDQHDLTRRILFSIIDACRLRNVYIYVVTGPGYVGYERLAKQIAGMDNVSLTHATGIISSIMEKVSLAITSNGRTVYEMAHMNIPAIVIPQHQREKTHAFAREENGFIALDPYRKKITEGEVLKALERLLDSSDFRRALYNRTVGFRFDENKQRVVELIDQQLQ